MSLRSRCTGALALAALSGAGAAWAGPSSHGGRATVVDGTAEVGGVTARVLFADTAELGPRGERREATLPVATNAAPLELSAVKLGASTVGMPEGTFSSASADTLLIRLPGLRVAADSVDGQAEARCDRGAPTLWARTRIENLYVNSTLHKVAGGPDEIITLPGLGTLVLNEQLRNEQGIEVRALHLRLDRKTAGTDVPVRADLIIGRAQASIACTP